MDDNRPGAAVPFARDKLARLRKQLQAFGLTLNSLQQELQQLNREHLETERQRDQYLRSGYSVGGAEERLGEVDRRRDQIRAELARIEAARDPLARLVARCDDFLRARGFDPEGNYLPSMRFEAPPRGGVRAAPRARVGGA